MTNIRRSMMMEMCMGSMCMVCRAHFGHLFSRSCIH